MTHSLVATWWHCLRRTFAMPTHRMCSAGDNLTAWHFCECGYRFERLPEDVQERARCLLR